MSSKGADHVLSEDLKKEIGQHFVFGFHGYDVSSDIEMLIRDYHLGNIILFKRNIQSIKQVHALTRKLQQIAKDAGHELPLMIGIDQENGLVSAFVPPGGEAGTQFPGAMALAATGHEDIARDVSTAAAMELRQAGINWAYSPVADVNSDARNPVIGVRSFSDDPEVASRFVEAVSSGIILSGVASCAKHFPGHGDTHVDSHLALPVINKTRKALEHVELIPFRSLIVSGIPSIMTAHIALPDITGNDEPASLSRKITHDMLRNELAYTGVVTTDCLEMEAIAGTIGTPAGTVAAIQADADIVMICHRIDRQKGAVEATYAAIREGRIPLDDFRESGKRIKTMKVGFAGTWEEVLQKQLDAGGIQELKNANKHLSERAYGQSTTIVPHLNPASSPLPLIAGESLVLYVPQRESVNPAVDDPTHIRNTLSPSYIDLGEELERRVGKDAFTLSVYTPDTVNIPPRLMNVVFAVQNAHIRTWQVDALKKLVAALPEGTGVVVVSTCAPYDLPAIEATVGTGVPCAVMATYEFTAPALLSAASVMFGEREAVGKIPVRLS